MRSDIIIMGVTCFGGVARKLSSLAGKVMLLHYTLCSSLCLYLFIIELALSLRPVSWLPTFLLGKRCVVKRKHTVQLCH